MMIKQLSSLLLVESLLGAAAAATINQKKTVAAANDLRKLQDATRPPKASPTPPPTLGAATGAPVAAAPQSISQIVCADANYSTLCSLLEMTGLYDTLNSPLYTLFAPDNASIDSVMGLANLTDEEIKALLMYHIAPNVLKYDELLAINGGEVETLIPDFKIGVTTGSDGQVLLNNLVKIVTPDILASNGIIQYVDQVIIPPTSAASTSTVNPTELPVETTPAATSTVITTSAAASTVVTTPAATSTVNPTELPVETTPAATSTVITTSAAASTVVTTPAATSTVNPTELPVETTPAAMSTVITTSAAASTVVTTSAATSTVVTTPAPSPTPPVSLIPIGMASMSINGIFHSKTGKSGSKTAKTMSMPLKSGKSGKSIKVEGKTGKGSSWSNAMEDVVQEPGNIDFGRLNARFRADWNDASQLRSYPVAVVLTVTVLTAAWCWQN